MDAVREHTAAQRDYRGLSMQAQLYLNRAHLARCGKIPSASPTGRPAGRS